MALRSAGISSVPDLIALSPIEVLRIDRLGARALEDIEAALALHAIRLSADAVRGTPQAEETKMSILGAGFVALNESDRRALLDAAGAELERRIRSAIAMSMSDDDLELPVRGLRWQVPR
jgi:hypothetical protein